MKKQISNALLNVGENAINSPGNHSSSYLVVAVVVWLELPRLGLQCT
jgi:hypothetical protein